MDSQMDGKHSAGGVPWYFQDRPLGRTIRVLPQERDHFLYGSDIGAGGTDQGKAYGLWKPETEATKKRPSRGNALPHYVRTVQKSTLVGNIEF